MPVERTSKVVRAGSCSKSAGNSGSGTWERWMVSNKGHREAASGGTSMEKEEGKE
jgi:hypothetical protein